MDMSDRERLLLQVCKWAEEGHFRPDFFDWIAENYHVYIEFERRALQIANRRQHYSARTIMEVIRHDTVIGQLSGEWKINDHATPDCARLFMLLHPEHTGLFEFRRRLAVQGSV